MPLADAPTQTEERAPVESRTLTAPPVRAVDVRRKRPPGLAFLLVEIALVQRAGDPIGEVESLDADRVLLEHQGHWFVREVAYRQNR